MNSLSEVLFRPLPLRHLVLPNRLIRSATYEGMADAEGNPTDAIGPLYRALLKGGVGTVITGFMYTSQEGHALQSRQCGMDSSIRIIPWRSILAAARIRPRVLRPGGRWRAEGRGTSPSGLSRRCSHTASGSFS